jgi:uncharacterized RDD family membrane protein YckC
MDNTNKNNAHLKFCPRCKKFNEITEYCEKLDVRVMDYPKYFQELCYGKYFKPLREHNTDESSMYAGLGKRFLAYLIDNIIFLIYLYAVVFPLSISYFINYDSSLVFILLLMPYILYNGLMEISPLQGTLGKVLCKIRITTVNGEPITFPVSVLRFIGKYFINQLTFGIGFFMATFTKKKQALHDIIANTVVINKE